MTKSKSPPASPAEKEEIGDEDLAKRYRDCLAQAKADKKELERRGYEVDARPKVPTIKRTKTTTTEL